MTTALLALSLVFQAPPALQARAQVTPELVCTVQHSLKWRRAAWPAHRCRRVAELNNATDSPDELLAIQVLESALDFAGIAWHQLPPGTGGGAPAPRRAARGGQKLNARPRPGEAGARAGTWTLSAGSTPRPRLAADVGLCGVRCLLGPDRRCTNWPVRGMTVHRLMRPAVNIRAAARILAWKRHTCGEKAHDCYLGNPSGTKGRTRDVRAIVAAFRGELVTAATKRAAALAKRIATAVTIAGQVAR